MDIRGKRKRSFWLSLLFFLCIFLWPQTVYAEKTSKDTVLTIETAVISSTSEEEIYLPLKLELNDENKKEVELENKKSSITLDEKKAGVCGEYQAKVSEGTYYYIACLLYTSRCV